MMRTYANKNRYVGRSYLKIRRCIDSLVNPEQAEAIFRMIGYYALRSNNWHKEELATLLAWKLATLRNAN